MNDPNVITGEEILREGLMVDERLYEYGGGPVVVEGATTAAARGLRRDGRRRRSTAELLEALGYSPEAAQRQHAEGDEAAEQWEAAYQAEFGAADARERAREQVARLGLAEALRERAEPRARRRRSSTRALLEELGYEPEVAAYGAARLRQLREGARPPRPLRPPLTSLDDLYDRMPRRRRRR